MNILKQRTGGWWIGTTAAIVCLLLTCTLWSTARGGQIVYPWRATTAIVKAGETFEVWFKADPGQQVTAARLESPFKTLAADIKSTSKTAWVYDRQSGETSNRKLFPLEDPPSPTEKNPAKYHPKLTISNAQPNNGTSTANTATLTNRFDFGIAGARVRFVMKKGNAYSVTGPAVITQQFDGDGDAGRVVDVRVDLGADSTRKVGISRVSSL